MVQLPWTQKTPATQIVECTAADYHAGRSHYMTSHMLDTFRHSPRLCQQKMNGLIKEQTKSYYELGTAAHLFILEGPAAFHERYTVANGPVNPKTGNCYGRDTKKFEEWIAEVEASGMKIVSDEEFQDIQAMADSIEESNAAELLHYGRPEVTIRGILKGVPCQSRLDFLDLDRVRIVDLKTTESLERFDRDFFKFKYDKQLAFYRSMVAGLALSDRVPEVYVIAVEKSPPYRVHSWQVTEATLSAAGEVNKLLLDQYRQVSKTVGNTMKWPISIEYGRTFGQI